MANHKSAKKRIRQTVVRSERNQSQTSEARTAIKAVRQAIAKNDKGTAQELFPQTQKLLSKLAQTGIIKKNTAARKTARLIRQINGL